MPSWAALLRQRRRWVSRYQHADAYHPGFWSANRPARRPEHRLVVGGGPACRSSPPPPVQSWGCGAASWSWRSSACTRDCGPLAGTTWVGAAVTRLGPPTPLLHRHRGARFTVAAGVLALGGALSANGCGTMRVAIFTENVPAQDRRGRHARRPHARTAAALGHEALVFAPHDPPAEVAGHRVVPVPAISFRPWYPELFLGLPAAAARARARRLRARRRPRGQPGHPGAVGDDGGQPARPAAVGLVPHRHHAVRRAPAAPVPEPDLARLPARRPQPRPRQPVHLAADGELGARPRHPARAPVAQGGRHGAVPPEQTRSRHARAPLGRSPRRPAAAVRRPGVGREAPRLVVRAGHAAARRAPGRDRFRPGRGRPARALRRHEHHLHGLHDRRGRWRARTRARTCSRSRRTPRRSGSWRWSRWRRACRRGCTRRRRVPTSSATRRTG
jgi:hypothetical protein